jgi:hypothetical protein
MTLRGRPETAHPDRAKPCFTPPGIGPDAVQDESLSFADWN